MPVQSFIESHSLIKLIDVSGLRRFNILIFFKQKMYLAVSQLWIPFNLRPYKFGTPYFISYCMKCTMCGLVSRITNKKYWYIKRSFHVNGVQYSKNPGLNPGNFSLNFTLSSVSYLAFISFVFAGPLTHRIASWGVKRSLASHEQRSWLDPVHCLSTTQFQ